MEPAMATTCPSTPRWNLERPFLTGQFYQDTKPTSRFSDSKGFSLDSSGLEKAIGCYNTSVQELIVMDDLLSAMVGIEGRYISIKRIRGKELDVTFQVDASMDLALQEMAKRIFPLCKSFLLIDHFVESRSQFKNGLVNHAFAAAVRAFLLDYQAMVAQLEHQFRIGRLSIQGLWFYCQPTMASMQALSDVTQKASANDFAGSAVLNLLQSQAKAMAGDNAVRSLLEKMTHYASNAYLSILERWVYEGVIDDPYGEFFIAENKFLQKESLTQDYDAKYWKQRYSLKDGIPSFLANLAGTILTTGKCLNVMRECGHNVQVPVSENSKLRIFGSNHHYLECIKAAHEFSSGELLNLIKEKYDLIGKLWSIKHYLLLDQGDFLVHFMDIAREELMKKLDEISVEKLQSLLDLALRTTAAAADPCHEDLTCYVERSSLLSSLGKLIVEIRTASDNDDLEEPVGITGLQTFTLSYKVKWPLSIVISKEALTKYQLLFRFLFHCKHVERQLCGAWQVHQGVRAMNSRGTAISRSSLLCRSMLKFINSLLHYLTFEVLEPNWHMVHSRIQNARSIDEVIQHHEFFLNKCLRECLLLLPELLKKVEKLKSLCLHYAAATQWLITSISITKPEESSDSPTPVNLPVAAVAKPAAYTSLGAHGPFPPPPAAAANAGALAGWMANVSASSSVQAAVVTASSIPVSQNQVASMLKRPRTPPANSGVVDYPNPDHEQLMKRLRPAQSVEEVTYPTPRQQASWSLDDLPTKVALTMHQSSTVTSMDFHPSHHTTLLVGSANGEITLWELALRERLVSKPFKVWDAAACSLPFQASMVKDAPISVSRVTWSPDGNFVGVAFTKHLIHLFACTATNDLRQHLEIDAHIGGVNDLAFSHPNKQLCVVTCGDDKLIKVWDLTGRKLFNFEGHEAPVYSICPHHKENIQFIFSTAIDGKIKAWLYDNMGSRVDYDAPGHWCTMLYSADGSRLFSCGTSKDGDSFLVEWNESEGAIKRNYTGFRKKSAGVVQFDTTQNHFLAAGEDGQIKFWDMDNNSVISSIDADGGLPALPRLRFNKEGNLLAVTTADNGFKILGNAAGLRSVRAIEAPSFEALRMPIDSASIKVSGTSAVATASPVNCKVERSSPVRPSPILNGVDPMGRSIEKPRTMDDVVDKTKPWQLAEIVDPIHCRLVTLPDTTDTSSKVVRLLYTNSGVGVLALGSNGIQKLWKWTRNEQNPSGKATANVVPQHWQPNSGLLMTNDVTGVNLEEAVPCIALSKNDSYVMSATGGKVSLFNMMTFKVMTTFMSPPPASTFLAFHPQDNNIIAIGMEDSTIHIYNVRVDEVKSKLKGHQKRITGLAFSTNLNILVSSGADAQLCVWSIDTWEKRKSINIQIPAGKAPTGDTRVQFHSDQIRMLVVHETQLAIYDASKMERVRHWVAQDGLSAPISYAAYSCNSQLVYATFVDGNIGVYDADSLRLRCRIGPSAYLPQSILNGSQTVYPLVVAAHPLEPNQFAIGLTDGSVKAMEPTESEGKWGASPPVDNGMLNGRTPSSSTTSNHTPDQLQR